MGCAADRLQVGSEEGEPDLSGMRAVLALLESTDLHSHVLSYDHFKLAEEPAIGLERMATLVRQAQREFENNLLFDGGDSIQGTALVDYQARVRKLPCAEELAIYKAMDALGYDGAAIGNHDFDFGLPFLRQVTGRTLALPGIPDRPCSGPHFPLILSNVFRIRDHQSLFPSYLLLTRPLKAVAPDGTTKTLNLRIGVLGFSPLQILVWNKSHLQNQVYVIPPIQAAAELVPKLRTEGADLIVALSHGGIDPSAEGALEENFSWHLSRVPGIDALLLGHEHVTFPDPDNPRSRFAGLPGVDNTRGTLNGVPAVMGSFWGKGLGVVKLALRYEKGRWQVDPENTRSEVRLCKQKDGSYVAPAPDIGRTVTAEHDATIAYLKTPIGESDFPITSYFAEVGDVSALQLINLAQRDYVKRYLKSYLPRYAKLPVLSMAAPFKTGFAGPKDYTDIPTGELSIRSAASLYYYDNTLTAVKVNGAELRAWIETAARHFNRIDPRRATAQPLINPDVRAYDFDVLQGDIRYTLDVTQPVGRRLVDLRYAGKAVTSGQEFIVATTNYRADGGGRFRGLDGSKTFISAEKTNREVLIEYIRKRRHLTRAEVACDRSWQFRPSKTAGPVTFLSAAGKLSMALAAGLSGISLREEKDDGMAEYEVDLSRPFEPAPTPGCALSSASRGRGRTASDMRAPAGCIRTLVGSGPRPRPCRTGR